MFRKQSVEIDPEKWAQVKALAALRHMKIRDWLDELIAKAIERKRVK
jgi:hypothetical protein